MIRKLFIGAILLASATAFAQSPEYGYRHENRPEHHHRDNQSEDVVLTKAKLKKVKFCNEDDRKEKLKCDDHGRLFRTERRGHKQEIATCGDDKRHTRWLVLHDDGRRGPYNLLGKNCKVKSARGWRCSSWEEIERVEFKISNEQRMTEWDDRFAVER